MEKYGVMVEHECECGEQIVLPTNATKTDIEKKASTCKCETHVHEFKPNIPEGAAYGTEKSSSIRPE